MKTLKFRAALAEEILKGEKTSTWRMFDDKNLRKGDVIALVNWDTGEQFGRAEIVRFLKSELGMLLKMTSPGMKLIKLRKRCKKHFVDTMAIR